MAGNVMEFVQDWYDDKYYSTGPTTDPQGPSIGEYKVLRGGCWNNSSYCDHPLLRSAGRFYLGGPSIARTAFIGFRCAWNP